MKDSYTGMVESIVVEPAYESLLGVLIDALEQAQGGKGKERHAAGEQFEDQEICANTRAVGLGYPLGQARKKAREATRLLEIKGTNAAIAECLGAINYLAAAVVVLEESRASDIAVDCKENNEWRFGAEGVVFGWCPRCKHYGQLDCMTLLCNNCHTFARG